MSKLVVYLVLIGLVSSILGYFGFAFYTSIYETPSNSPTGSYTLIVSKGDTLVTISQKLSDDKVIGSNQALLIQNSYRSINNLQTGEFQLQLPAKPDKILDQIVTQNETKTKEIVTAPKVPTVSITFKEGKTADQMFEQLETAGVTTKAELIQLATNPGTFSTDQYPFLPKSLDCEYGNLKTCIKYYLEGYLYPDTYDFFKPEPARQVLTRFLNNFNTKVWSKVKDSLNGKNFDKAISLAAVVDKETGRTAGITDNNREELRKERFTMAQVFYNRLSKKIPWQSDVTSEYGTERRLCQQTFKVPNCLALDDPLTDTLYNTYNISGYPIGPITSPQLENIQAAINPTDNNFIFFVSDATGRKYFAENETAHFANIAKVSKINRDLGL